VLNPSIVSWVVMMVCVPLGKVFGGWTKVSLMVAFFVWLVALERSLP
jgi:hypothetical protein